MCKRKLDKYQLKAIKSKRKTILLLAGAGCGKTYTIVNKVRYMIKKLGVKKEEILCVSFTNDSVNKLKKDLSDDKVEVLTFHKLALKIIGMQKDVLTEDMLTDVIIDSFSNNTLLGLYKMSKEDMVNLIKTFINLFKTNNHDIDSLKNIVKNYQDKYLLKIILDIFYLYEEEKNSTGSLDFDDLIIIATKILMAKYNYKNFKYIIIDEFQDTSLIRFNLAKTIIDNTGAILTAVGDDAQSIYHFSGCDLFIFLNLHKYINNLKELKLVNTYRFSQELIDISANFINKNPFQLDKSMHGFTHINKPLEIIYYLNAKKKFKNLLNKLSDKKILILGRNQKDIYEYIDKDFEYNNGILKYNDKEYKYLTIHSAKGLEEDYVILLNVSNSTYGLPNKIENHNILSYVSSKEDDYPFAEERRVFFVAITRCKFKTYLMVPKNNPSIFIEEIKKVI